MIKPKHTKELFEEAKLLCLTKEEKAAGRSFLTVYIKKNEAKGHALIKRNSFKNSLIAALFGTAILSIGIAQGAEGSLPGEILFPVKLATEAVIGTLIRSTEERATWESGLARKRLEEMSSLAEKKQLTPYASAIAQKNLAKHLINARMNITRLATENEKFLPRAAELNSNIESALNAYGKILDWKDAKEASQALMLKAEEVANERVKTERRAAPKKKKDQSAHKKIELDLKKAESRVMIKKDEAVNDGVQNPAVIEAESLLENAFEKATESREKTLKESHEEAFILDQEIQRNVDEIEILVGIPHTKKQR